MVSGSIFNGFYFVSNNLLNDTLNLFQLNIVYFHVIISIENNIENNIENRILNFGVCDCYTLQTCLKCLQLNRYIFLEDLNS